MTNNAASISVSLVGDATELTSALTSALVQFELFKGGVELVFKGIQVAFEGLKTALDSAGEIQALASSFQVLMGSASQSQELVNSLNQLSASTHLSIDSLGNAARTLLSFGVAGKNVLPDIRELSEVAGGNAERFRRLSLAFAETAATGRLMGQEVRQFVNAGFNPLQEISQRTGKSIAQLRQDMAAGNITFAQVSDAFKTATSAGGRFFGFTEQQAQTWSGLVATLQNRVKQLFIEFGTPVIDALAPLLRNGISLVNSLQAGARRLGEIFATVSGTLINAFVSGDLASIIELSLQVGIKKAVNYLAGGLLTAAELFGVALAGAYEMIFDPSVIGGLIKIFTGLSTILGGLFDGVALSFAAGLLGAIKSPMDYLIAASEYAAIRFSSIISHQAVPAFEKILEAVRNATPLSGAVKTLRNTAAETVKGTSVAGGEIIASGGRDIAAASSVKNTIGSITDSIKAFQPVDIFNSKEQEDKLRALIAKNLYVPNKTLPPDRPLAPNVEGEGDGSGGGVKNRKGLVALGDSLTQIGGGGGFSITTEPIVDAQGETNEHLTTANQTLGQIEQNTRKGDVNTPATSAPVVDNAAPALTDEQGNIVDPNSSRAQPGGVESTPAEESRAMAERINADKRSNGLPFDQFDRNANPQDLPSGLPRALTLPAPFDPSKLSVPNSPQPVTNDLITPDLGFGAGVAPVIDGSTAGDKGASIVPLAGAVGAGNAILERILSAIQAQQNNTVTYPSAGAGFNFSTV